MMPLRILQKAQREFDQGADWYEDQEPGRGVSDRFTDAVNSVLLEIASNPLRWPKVRKSIREALVMGWPYAVYYRIRPQLIEIISIFNTHRDPKRWMGRT